MSESTSECDHLFFPDIEGDDDESLSEFLASLPEDAFADEEATSSGGLEDFEPETKKPKHDYSYVRFATTTFFREEPASVQAACEAFVQKFQSHFEALFEDGKVTYVVAGLEQAPTTQKWHVQGYVELPPRAKRRLGPVTRMFAVAGFQPPHVEPARKSGDDNRAYCLKVDSGPKPPAWFEFGKIRDIRPVGVRNKALWDDTRMKAEAGQFAGIHSQHYVSFFPNIQKIHFSAPHALQDLQALNNTWIVGKPGVGKSRGARLIGELKCPVLNGVRQLPYFKPANNKWWDSYQQEKVVIMDDMELDAKYMGHELKLVSDMYRARVEIKGASTMIRPDMIIVTSNYTPDEIWSQDNLCAEAVKRRFRVVRIHQWAPFEAAVRSDALFNIPVDSYTVYGEEN